MVDQLCSEEEEEEEEEFFFCTRYELCNHQERF
jgi:hypothetical protein